MKSIFYNLTYHEFINKTGMSLYYMNYLHSLQMLALTYQTFYYVKIFSIQYVTDIGTPFICFLRSCPQSTEMRVNTFKGFYQFFLLPLIVLCVFRSVPTSAYKCALIMMKIWAGSVYGLIKYIYDTLHSREITNRFSFFVYMAIITFS